MAGVPHNRAISRGQGRRGLPKPSLRTWAVACAVVFLILLVDAVLNPRAFFDLWLMREIQAIEILGLARLIDLQEILTDSSGAIVAWAVTSVLFATLRWWVPLLGLLTLPLGGAINYVIGEFVERPRPHLDVLLRASANPEERSFPSGHVQGAVMLYGFLFVVAERIRNRVVRLAVQIGCAAMIATVGFARVWDGAHWPTDALGGYALGGLMLVGLLAVYCRVDAAVGDLPLIHAAPVPHDERQPHAHALTSTILFRDETVAKIYNPGLVPRLIYWLSFQAPFAYERNLDALRAAMHRRNLVGMLTEHWYGANRVSRALGIERIGGRYALIGEFVAGTEPRDHDAGRTFLFELADRFDEAGLPTWQIDPRQPRSLGNIIEQPDGTYKIIDLESGLVSPLASPRAWKRAIERGLVPFYDDVYFDLTRACVERQAEAMRAAHGDAWLADLRSTLDEAEAAANAWHTSEPRIWSRLVRGVRSGFGIRTLPARVRHAADEGRGHVLEWLEEAVAAWRSEGRLTEREAAALDEAVESPQFQTVIPHFGLFLVMGIPLRFPISAIARVIYVVTNQIVAAARLFSRRIDRRQWQQTMAVHSPLVLLFAAMPVVGKFSYLAAKPVRSNHLLFRVTLDAVLLKLPWRVYERTGLRRLIARPASERAAGMRSTQTAVESKVVLSSRAVRREARHDRSDPS